MADLVQTVQRNNSLTSLLRNQDGLQIKPDTLALLMNYLHHGGKFGIVSPEQTQGDILLHLRTASFWHQYLPSSHTDIANYDLLLSHLMVCIYEKGYFLLKSCLPISDYQIETDLL